MSPEGIDEAPQPDPSRVTRPWPRARVIGFAAALIVWLVLCAFCGPRFQMELYASEPHVHGWWVRDAHVLEADPALLSPAFCVDVAIECPRHNSDPDTDTWRTSFVGDRIGRVASMRSCSRSFRSSSRRL